MSLGKPDLYIGGQKMQTAKDDPRPAMAGLKLTWGTDDRMQDAPASTLSGQLLIRGAIPSLFDVGAPVGLLDPASSRTLFAGYLQPLKASPDPSIKGAMRVQFTAAAPAAELEKHTVLDINWPIDQSANDRRWLLGQSMPAGWSLLGESGVDWLMQGHQKYRSASWLGLLRRYVRGNLQRFHDGSIYIPAHGLQRRLIITNERGKTAPASPSAPARGRWVTSHVPYASGLAVLPAAAVLDSIEWEKTPADVTTAVQITTSGRWLVNPGENDESPEHEFPLDWAVDTSALRAAHGFHPLRVETAMSPQIPAASRGMAKLIVDRYLDVQTKWRPTNLTIHDSRLLDTEPLRNLLAVDTRPMAAVSVPAYTTGPGRIYAFVLGGTAAWTGQKWETELTLGPTL